MKHVLSISGGGMRGIIPARILVEIERRTRQSIADSFDLLAGTSTGGILACLAASPDALSAERSMEFYYESGPRIFRPSLLRDLYSAHGSIHTKYQSAPLAAELARCLGPHPLADARTRLMVTALESRRRATMIKNWSPEWSHLAMATAALMTSSAQTYFPQAQVTRHGLTERYLDGGNVRNSPMACAAFEAGALWGFSEPITLIHLGTGRARHPKPLPNGGALFWAAEIFDCTTNADDSYDDYFCRGLEQFVPGFRYHRLDVELDTFPAMDDATPRTLDHLVRETESALAHDSATLDAICATLTKTKAPA